LLKILAGDARGRVLRTPPKNPLVRPILARIKKSIFDIIRPRLPDCTFLDLYAGTGAVGIEALSRGASACTFVEQDALCLKLINENLAMLKLTPKATVVRASVLGNLASVKKPFDIIFMGPPYKDAEKKPLALTEPTLVNIDTLHLLAPNGLVIAQHHNKEIVPKQSGRLILKREKEYGDTVVSFYQFEKET
jgi:16S rRNA (guanine966-N2)-methyltransferase